MPAGDGTNHKAIITGNIACDAEQTSEIRHRATPQQTVELGKFQILITSAFRRPL